MNGGSAESTLARMEAALNRIERAADRIRNDRDAAALRHASLRASVAESLDQLDVLISGRTP